MATNKTTVSIYPDDNLLEALKSFQSQGNYKSLNVAAIAILREKLLGDVSSTLQSNVSSTLDIQNLIDAALDSFRNEYDAEIAAKLLPLENQINQMDIRIRAIPDDVQTSLDPIHSQLQELREAIAPAKKALVLSPNLKVIALKKVLQVA